MDPSLKLKLISASFQLSVIFLYLFVISVLPASGANCPDYGSFKKNFADLGLENDFLIEVSENNLSIVIDNSDFSSETSLQSFDAFKEIYKLNSAGTPVLIAVNNNPVINNDYNHYNMIPRNSNIIIGSNNTAIVLGRNMILEQEIMEFVKSCKIDIILKPSGVNYNIWEEHTTLSYKNLFMILNQPFNFQRLKFEPISIGSQIQLNSEILKKLISLDETEEYWHPIFHIPSQEDGLILAGIDVPRNAFRISQRNNDYSDLFYLSKFKDNNYPRLVKHKIKVETVFKINSNEKKSLLLNSTIPLNENVSLKYGLDIKSDNSIFGNFWLNGQTLMQKRLLFHWSMGKEYSNRFSINGNLLRYNWSRNTGFTSNINISRESKNTPILELGFYGHKYQPRKNINFTSGINIKNDQNKNKIGFLAEVSLNHLKSFDFRVGSKIDGGANNIIFLEIKKNFIESENSKLQAKTLLNTPRNYSILQNISNYWHAVSKQLSQPLKNNWREVFNEHN